MYHYQRQIPPNGNNKRSTSGIALIGNSEHFKTMASRRGKKSTHEKSHKDFVTLITQDYYHDYAQYNV